MFRDFQMMRSSLDETVPRTVVVAAAHDEHTIEAIHAATGELPMQFVLVGDRSRINELASKTGLICRADQIMDAADDVECATRAVELIRNGAGDMLMKGRMETSTLLKAVVHRQTGIRESDTMSHLAVLEVPLYHKLVGITDGGMIPTPTLEQKMDIVRNSVGFFSGLGVENPRIAALAASESISDRMPETKDAATLQELCSRGELGCCRLEGPLSFDIAVDLASAQIKGHASEICGDVDILLVPNITAGNILSKGLIYWAHARMAGCVLGAQVPIVLVSRGATAQEKLLSIMMCIKAAHANMA